MKTKTHENAIGIPAISIAYPLDHMPQQALLTFTPTENDQSHTDMSSALKKSRINAVVNRMNKLGKKAENLRGKLSLGATMLRFGRVNKIFERLFCVREGEKLLKASRCYLSTTAGPIAGLLFVSTEKIAFCSRRSIKLFSQNGELIRAHYKVVIPVNKIKRVDQSENVEKPSQKYIEIVTVDNFDFWFMDFYSYQKAFRYLKQTVSQS